MEKKFIAYSSAQTKKIGEKMAKKILRGGWQKTAFVIGLLGDLGGGKTCFLQGFAKGLGIEQRITSPTFVIMRKYKTNQSDKSDRADRIFYHFDCYRIQKPKEILDLGFEKIISNPKNIVAVEWAERIKKVLPKNTLFLKFDFVGKNKRKITFSFPQVFLF